MEMRTENLWFQFTVIPDWLETFEITLKLQCLVELLPNPLKMKFSVSNLDFQLKEFSNEMLSKYRKHPFRCS